MITVHFFTFSPFGENTYILFDETHECLIIDPGCYDNRERAELVDFITNKKLKPVKLLNTHCHLDHVFGNGFVAETYKLKLEAHRNELPVLANYLRAATMYDLNAEPSPDITVFLEEGEVIKFGNSSLEILFTPGHSPGSITFFNRAQQFMISGDVLFNRSIGRTDLPGGNHNTLIHTIQQKLFPLGDEFKVHSGHGPVTTIGSERVNNPYVKNIQMS
jgi:glyoxylase-like metal-dependent hydrolase (beta-lactamase superfamily II)